MLICILKSCRLNAKELQFAFYQKGILHMKRIFSNIVLKNDEYTAYILKRFSKENK